MQSKTRQTDPAGYLSMKTIVALATPLGGALGVVRISGGLAHALLEKLTQKPLAHFAERVATRSWIYGQNGQRLDDAVIVRYLGPKSFTGEDVIEIFIHGSPMISSQLIEDLCSWGARVALPGEFSFRAVKNGKLQLSQAEAIKEVIAADNQFSLDLALEKLSGSQHEFIQGIQKQLMELVTLAEAGIDFSDQDIDEVSLPQLKKRLDKIASTLETLSASFDRGRRLQEGVPVVFLGRPNAGKSSFFNALLGEDRSIVSEIPGTTRDVVRERIHLRPEPQKPAISFRVSDTAGIRKTGDAIESIGMERSLKAAQEAEVVVALIDGLNPALEDVHAIVSQVLERSSEDRPDVLFVVSKKDEVPPQTMIEIKKKILERYPSFAVVACSATQLDGVQEAAQEIAKRGEGRLSRKPGEVVLTQVEHLRAVQAAWAGLERARETTDIVLLATEVRHAMNELAPLLGQTVADDILGKIFSDFCIGK